jgi:hypothetical protein
MQGGVWLDRPNAARKKDVSYPEFLDEAAGAAGVPRSSVAAAAAIRCAMKPSLATAGLFSTNG